MDLQIVNQKGHKHDRKFRVGRGIGSGNGKTCGRGTKGLKARSGASRRPGYEGGQMPIYRRVPKRGFTNARFKTEYTIVNVGLLGSLPAGEAVDLDLIIRSGLASRHTNLLKVLGNGDLQTALTVRAHKFSQAAADKIRAAGGTVVELDPRGGEVIRGEQI